MRRVFREDVLEGSCGGRRVVLAFLSERRAVKAVLEHLRLPTTPLGQADEAVLSHDQVIEHSDAEDPSPSANRSVNSTSWIAGSVWFPRGPYG